ncbi:MAG TPA: hypothetical protein VLR92_01955, partial [Blastocatellia bacterium]|nr:hypothetical protein [Blastocatellia bacterium]
MKSLRVILLIGLISSGLAVVGSAARNSTVSEALPPAETQADFDLMRWALEEAHSGLYRYSSKAEMGRVFDAERVRLTRPLTKVEFMAVLVETLAQIRCGHTGVTPDEATQKELAAARMFPIRVMIEGRRLMVLSNDTLDDQTIRPGMEILEIDGHKAADILSRILPKVPTDGDIETGKRVRLQIAFPRNYWLFVEQTSDFIVKVRDPNGKIVTSRLAGVTESERPKNSNQNPVNAELQSSSAKLRWWSGNLALRFVKDP